MISFLYSLLQRYEVHYLPLDLMLPRPFIRTFVSAHFPSSDFLSSPISHLPSRADDLVPFDSLRQAPHGLIFPHYRSQPSFVSFWSRTLPCSARTTTSSQHPDSLPSYPTYSCSSSLKRQPLLCTRPLVITNNIWFLRPLDYCEKKTGQKRRKNWRIASRNGSAGRLKTTEHTSDTTQRLHRRVSGFEEPEHKANLRGRVRSVK